MAAALQELEQSIKDVAAKVGESVVGVGERWGMGSGFVIAPGKVATNAHNVRDGAVEITFNDGRKERAEVAATDIDSDLAVLNVETGSAPPLPTGEDGASIGTVVFALANPGGRGLRVSFGSVTGTERSFRGPRGRRISGTLEHTAPLLPGSSGGPVVTAEGKLLGINTNRLGEGFYLAIPAGPQLSAALDQLSRGEKREPRKLGVALAGSRQARGMRKAVGLPEMDGLLVRGVEEGPARAAGIQQGDLLAEVNGKKLESVDDLFEALQSDEKVLKFRVVRGVEEITAEVKF